MSSGKSGSRRRSSGSKGKGKSSGSSRRVEGSKAAELKKKYFDDYFRGEMLNKREAWVYEKGAVTPSSGNYRNVSYTWNGSVFSSGEDESTGYGVFNGSKLKWYFPGHSSPFYEYTMESETSFKLTGGKMASPKAWSVSSEGDTVISPEDVNDAEEDRMFPTLAKAIAIEIQGDVPEPLQLFLAAFSWANGLKEAHDARAARSLKRCKKFVVSTAKAASPKICNVCAAEGDKCMACNGDLSKGSYDGYGCSTCSPQMRGTCSKCGDALGGAKNVGKLCANCGLGSRANDCCRMKG